MTGARPSPAVRMLAAGGVALEDAADTARCYPELWTAEGARKAFQRARFGTAPKALCPAPLCRASYQRAGAGTRPTALMFDPVVVPPGELRTWLEARVGSLARFELDPTEPLRPSEAASPPQTQQYQGNEPENRPAASGHVEQQLAPTDEGVGGDAVPAPPEPEEPARTSPGAAGGAERYSAASEDAEAPCAPPEPAAPPAGSAELQAVQILWQRLRLAALVERLHDARPKREHGVRELDRQAWEAASRAASGLPSGEWAAWRAAFRTADALR